MSDPQPYFDPDYEPTAAERAGDSWTHCYGQPTIILTPDPLPEVCDEHH